MRLYLAGPMTGKPQFNFPDFDRMAGLLRANGYEVVNPAELDDPKSRAAALASVDGALGSLKTGETWGDFLSRDVKLIADGGIDGVVVLLGWEKSRGARLETFVARALCGKTVYTWGGGVLRIVPALTLVKAWAGPLWSEVTGTVRRMMREFAA